MEENKSEWVQIRITRGKKKALKRIFKNISEETHKLWDKAIQDHEERKTS